MRKINPARIPGFIKRDVELIKKEARFVLTISRNETFVTMLENENPRLNVFAVIGPSEGFGRHWDEVLLAEIGIARTRPYNQVTGLNKTLGQKKLNRRRKWFSLSEKQYQVVAQIIFKTMDVRAERTVSSWKSGSLINRFLVPATRHFWLRKKKRMLVNDYMIEAPAGIRFSVSLRDEFFVRDVFWAELNLNKALKDRIDGLAKFISLRLNWYKASNYKGRKKVEDLVGYQQVKARIESCYLGKFPHLMMELAKKLKQDSRLTFFFPYLADIFKWYGEETEESRLASLAREIPHLTERLDKIQVLVTADLSKKRDFITFEVQK